MINLILVMETCSSSKTDYIYIKAALDYYYKNRGYHIAPIYAGSKTQLTKKKQKIENCNNLQCDSNIVVICADFDEESTLNDEICSYVKENNYILVWMNKDIEDVFLGHQINKKYKKKEADNFAKKKDLFFNKSNKLKEKYPLNTMHSSNLIYELDKYLPKI